jgi:hypothetical protein
VLQESGGAGDEWIAQLISTASPDALAAAMIMPGGDGPLTPQSGEGEDVEIVITGPRLYYNGELGGGGDPGSGGDNTGGGGGGGEGGSGGSGGVAVAQHEQDCGTEDGAAVQVAKHVKGTLPAGVSGPVNPLTTSTGNDWTKVEFGAVIVRNPDGSFGALNNMIYSSDVSGFVVYPNIAGQPVQGLWHSHDRVGDDADKLLLDRYPSSYDWNSLSVVAAQPGAVSDPSLWVMDAFGVTREFKLSERNYFENLGDPQKKIGDGLAGKERTQSCG